MTDVEAFGLAHQEKKKIEGELKTRRVKVLRYGDSLSRLAQLLNSNPAGAVFDDQVSPAGVMECHFTSAEFDIADIAKLVAEIRALESRLKDLNAQLA
jgi:hypothetical protein